MNTLDLTAYDKGHFDGSCGRAYDPAWNYQESQKEAYKRGFDASREHLGARK